MYKIHVISDACVYEQFFARAKKRKVMQSSDKTLDNQKTVPIKGEMLT